jgi:hypothetical protein
MWRHIRIDIFFLWMEDSVWLKQHIPLSRSLVDQIGREIRKRSLILLCS